jgi:hypothetical protein
MLNKKQETMERSEKWTKNDFSCFKLVKK